MAARRGRRHSAGYNGGQPFPYSEHQMKKVRLPQNLDWRLYGAVTQVKDQATCGSCWSFGTAGTIEGSYFLKTG
ncbi:C1 family peptidase, partial [Neisseria meningitidis]|uniref:C1 family peptidase n=1 Tax=Neisseria meningitidis TaxID=487 RepID=UPI001C563E32